MRAQEQVLLLEIAEAAEKWRDTVYLDRAGGEAGVWPEEQVLAEKLDSLTALRAGRAAGPVGNGLVLLLPQEAAAMFLVHPKTLARWADKGRLTTVRTVGNRRRYYHHEVKALMVALAKEQ